MPTYQQLLLKVVQTGSGRILSKELLLSKLKEERAQNGQPKTSTRAFITALNRLVRSGVLLETGDDCYRLVDSESTRAQGSAVRRLLPLRPPLLLLLLRPPLLKKPKS